MKSNKLILSTIFISLLAVPVQFVVADVVADSAPVEEAAQRFSLKWFLDRSLIINPYAICQWLEVHPFIAVAGSVGSLLLIALAYNKYHKYYDDRAERYGRVSSGINKDKENPSDKSANYVEVMRIARDELKDKNLIGLLEEFYKDKNSTLATDQINARIHSHMFGYNNHLV